MVAAAALTDRGAGVRNAVFILAPDRFRLIDAAALFTVASIGALLVNP